QIRPARTGQPLPLSPQPQDPSPGAAPKVRSSHRCPVTRPLPPSRADTIVTQLGHGSSHDPPFAQTDNENHVSRRLSREKRTPGGPSTHPRPRPPGTAARDSARFRQFVTQPRLLSSDRPCHGPTSSSRRDQDR